MRSLHPPDAEHKGFGHSPTSILNLIFKNQIQKSCRGTTAHCLPQLCVILLWGKVWKIYLPQGCTTEMVCSIPYFGCSVQWIRIESRYCRKSRTSLHQKQSPKEQLLNLLIDAQLNLTESKSTGYARWAKRQFTKHNVCQWFIIVKR